MKRLAAPVSAVIAPAVAATTLLTAPANAAPSDIAATVSQAESRVAQAQATPDTSSAVLPASGAGVQLGDFDIAFDGAGIASANGELLVAPGRDVTYTADDLGDGAARLTAVFSRPGTLQASWTFGDGVELQQLGETISIVKDDNLVAAMEAPWAVDAAGVSVPTRYEVRGQRLVQVIETDASTVFPVVADPTIVTKIWGVVVRLTKTESYTATGTVAGCAALFSKVQHWSGKVLQVGCGTLAAISTSQIAAGKCMRINVHPGGQFYPWWGTC